MVKEIIRYENGKKITIFQGEGLDGIITPEEGSIRLDAYMKVPEWSIRGGIWTRPITNLFYYFWYLRLKLVDKNKKIS